MSEEKSRYEKLRKSVKTMSLKALKDEQVRLRKVVYGESGYTSNEIEIAIVTSELFERGDVRFVFRNFENL